MILVVMLIKQKPFLAQMLEQRFRHVLSKNNLENGQIVVIVLAQERTRHVDRE